MLNLWYGCGKVTEQSKIEDETEDATEGMAVACAAPVPGRISDQHTLDSERGK